MIIITTIAPEGINTITLKDMNIYFKKYECDDLDENIESD